MKYILDTHLLVWALFDDAKLPREAYDIINDADNEIFYSAASVWEIEIKHAKAPDRMPISGKTLADWCDSSDMIPLPITKDHAYRIGDLVRRPDSPPHSDPFDRMLIAQAKSEDMILLTHDSLLGDYTEVCVQTI